MTGNIYLVGFMGSGKSTVGCILSEMLHLRFIDLDTILEDHFNAPISTVFAELGEEIFRSAESAFLLKLAGQKGLVVATGGGVPIREKNRDVMRCSGAVVHLQSELASCSGRLTQKERASRPLWQDERPLSQLFESRKDSYADSHIQVGADSKSPEEVAATIVERLYGDRQFQVQLGTRACPIVATWRAPDVVNELIRGRRTVILTDRTVAGFHQDRFAAAVSPSATIVMQAGERTKSLSTAHRVYEQLLEAHMDRDSLFIALGGGVMTDLGAFVASTFKRGMDFVLVSTSLVGIVDAAVGGKAAVNLTHAKNIVGAFTTPEAVVLDLAALRTLGQKHRSEGLVEAYKTGLIGSPELAGLIERQIRCLLNGDVVSLAHVGEQSARIKASVVSKDFREGGLRRILNFGHTFGHAVEGYHELRVSHGQAVAVGMIVATRVSRNRGLISSETADTIIRTIGRIVPRPPASPPIDEAWKIMLHDKKIRAGKMVFVLLEGVGLPVCVEDVSRKELEKAML